MIIRMVEINDNTMIKTVVDLDIEEVCSYSFSFIHFHFYSIQKGNRGGTHRGHYHNNNNANGYQKSAQYQRGHSATASQQQQQ